jgi:hypothetical protein
MAGAVRLTGAAQGGAGGTRMALMGRMDDAAGRAFLAARKSEIKKAGTLQEAAQQLMDCFHGEFAESIVLARTFATVPFHMLPPRDRSFIETHPGSEGSARLLTEDTPVLSLMGTSGVEPAWCDRYRSRDHLGIPLPPGRFGAWSSMVTVLTRQLGRSVDWFAVRRPGTAPASFSVFADDFFVDATSSRDEDGRLLIPAQDFVRAYQVQTVSGVGGQFAATGMILACVFFSREILSRPSWLSRVPLLLGNVTLGLVSAGKIYSAAEPAGPRNPS